LSIKRFRKKHLRVIIPRLPWLSPGDSICTSEKIAALSDEWLSLASPSVFAAGFVEAFRSRGDDRVSIEARIGRIHADRDRASERIDPSMDDGHCREYICVFCDPRDPMLPAARISSGKGDLMLKMLAFSTNLQAAAWINASVASGLQLLIGVSPHRRRLPLCRSPVKTGNSDGNRGFLQFTADILTPRQRTPINRSPYFPRVARVVFASRGELRLCETRQNIFRKQQ